VDTLVSVKRVVKVDDPSKLLGGDVTSATKFKSVSALLRSTRSGKLAAEFEGDGGPVVYIRLNYKGKTYAVGLLSDHSHVIGAESEVEANEVLDAIFKKARKAES